MAVLGTVKQFPQSPTQNPSLEGAIFVSHAAFRTECPALSLLRSPSGPDESLFSLNLWPLVCIKLRFVVRR